MGVELTCAIVHHNESGYLTADIYLQRVPYVTITAKHGPAIGVPGTGATTMGALLEEARI